MAKGDTVSCHSCPSSRSLSVLWCVCCCPVCLARRHWMPALVLIGYWALFTGAIFVALQYLPRKHPLHGGTPNAAHLQPVTCCTHCVTTTPFDSSPWQQHRSMLSQVLWDAVQTLTGCPACMPFVVLLPFPLPSPC